MHNFRRPFFAVVGYLTLFGVLALVQQTTAHSQVARTVVRVRQDGPSDSVPVSIQGSTSINLAPNAQVGILPTGNTVIVGNTRAAPVPVRLLDPGTAEVFQAYALQNFSPNSYFLVAGIKVPDGKRLIVEYFSVEAGVPLGEVVVARFRTTRQGGGAEYGSVAMTLQGTAQGESVFVGDHLAHLVSDGVASGFLEFTFDRFPGTGGGHGTAFVSGHLVDF